MADHAGPASTGGPVQALAPRRLAVPWVAVAALAAVAIGVLAIWFPWLLPGLHASGMPPM